MGLSKQEHANYAKHGYVVPEYKLPPPQLERLRLALDEVIASNPDVRPEKLVSVHIPGRNAEGIVGHQAFMDIASDPAILDLVEALIGPNIVLWGCQAFCKPGGDGFEVPWHQDGHYWPIRPLANCSVWIALDDSVIENGCLRVLAGSHQAQELHQHYVDDREDLTLTSAIEPGYMQGHEVVDVELRAGEMSLHDVYMVHGSNPNRSPKRRAGLAIRYMPASSVFRRDLYDPTDSSGFLVDFSTRPLWLLRGQDQSEQNDFQVGHG